MKTYVNYKNYVNYCELMHGYDCLNDSFEAMEEELERHEADIRRFKAFREPLIVQHTKLDRRALRKEMRQTRLSMMHTSVRMWWEEEKAALRSVMLKIRRLKRLF